MACARVEDPSRLFEHDEPHHFECDRRVRLGHAEDEDVYPLQDLHVDYLAV